MMRRTKPASKKRHRNVAHLWADKRVLRFFRKCPGLEKKHYKNLRSIYLALCEMDSDFGEGVKIGGFAKTVATYSGLHEDTIQQYLQILREVGLIEYPQANNGRFGSRKLEMYKWEEAKRSKKEIALIEALTETSGPGKNRPREKPAPGKTGPGKNRTYKNPKGSPHKGVAETYFKRINKHLPEEWQKDTAFQKMLMEFSLHRKQIHQEVTPLAGKRLANKLCKYDRHTTMIALRQSIENGWTGVFPKSVLKERSSGKSTIGSNRSGGNYDLYDRGAKKVSLIKKGKEE